MSDRRSAMAAWRGACRRLGSDDGSLVLALLATIVVGGLVTVIVAAVLAGQRSVLFDQDYTGALHIGEAGVEQVVYRLNNDQIADEDSPVSGSGALNGKPFEWTATQLNEHEWEVVSEGGDDDGVTRTVRTIVADQPLFDLAAFSDVLVNYAGSNTADSYHSQELEWCTGVGRVGSNDDLDFSGGSTGQCTVVDDDGNAVPNATVDGVDLFDWASAADPGRCVHSTGTPNNCWADGAGTPRFTTHDDPIEFDPQIDWATDALETCEGTPQMMGDIVVSEHPDFADGIEPAGELDGPRLNPEDDESPYVYCAESLEFDQDTLLDGGSLEDPVVFVLADFLSVRSHTHVNCEGCQPGGGWEPKNDDVFPVAPALQIYTPSSENPTAGVEDVIAIRQHARVSAAVFAPWGTCGGVGNAAVHLFGAMICGDIRNAGGWQFHYDEALRDAVRTGEYEVTSWEER